MTDRKCEYSPVYFDSPRKKWFKGYYLVFPNYYSAREYRACDNNVWTEGGDDKYCIFHSFKDSKEGFSNRFNIYRNDSSNNNFFVGFVFPKDFKFRGISSLKDANFYDATFFCKADFNSITFYGDYGTNFMGACFRNGANFTSAAFEGKGQVGFYYARFIGDEDIIFNWAEFLNKGRVNFSKAIFVGGAQLSFSQTIFSGNSFINFENSYISLLGGLSFNNASFLENTAMFFKGTVFDYGTVVDFRDVNVDEAKKVSFDKVDLAYCNFLGTNLKKIEFKESYFNREYEEYLINLFGSRFIEIERDRILDEIILEKKNDENAIADKIIAEIDNIDYGNRAKILRDLCNKEDWECKVFLDIVEQEFKDVNKRSGFKKKLTKNFSAIKRLPEEKRENKHNKTSTDLYKERKQLHRTIINSIDDRKMRNMYWTLLEKINARKGDLIYNRVFDNIERVKKREYRSTSLIRNIRRDQYKEYYKVKQAYSQLRLSYEDSGRYHEAGEFFIGEMEMRRIGDFESWWRKPILWVYQGFSLYGERPLWAFLWLLYLWTIFGLFYYIGSFLGIEHIPEKEGIIAGIFDNNHLIQSLRISLSNLTLGKIEPLYRLTSNTLDAVLKLLETILGATSISLFVLAMNRKFRRTKD